MIYDYAGGASYELSDRGNFDYVLNMQEDSLVVEKRVYMQNELVESGELVFLDDTLPNKNRITNLTLFVRLEQWLTKRASLPRIQGTN